MNPRLLLDTHILLRWIADSRRLSRDQMRLMNQAERRQELFAISEITLMELALLRVNPGRLSSQIEQAFNAIEVSETIQVLPLTVEIAREITPLIGLLRDPADCVIVATAQVHGLRLLTSDQRILDSNLTPVVG